MTIEKVELAGVEETLVYPLHFRALDHRSPAWSPKGWCRTSPRPSWLGSWGG